MCARSGGKALLLDSKTSSAGPLRKAATPEGTEKGRAEVPSLPTAPRLGIATGEAENRDDRDNSDHDEGNHGGPLFLLFRLLYGKVEANRGKHVCA